MVSGPSLCQQGLWELHLDAQREWYLRQDILTALAENRTLAAGVQLKLASLSDAYVKLAVTSALDLMPATQHRLVSEGRELRIRLAEHKSLVPEVHDTLAADPDEEVVLALAELSASSQSRLASSEEPEHRARLARRADLPPELQEPLAADADENVRTGIAHRQDLLPDLQPVLARDTAVLVRAAIAARDDLLPDLVSELETDPERQVRENLETRGEPVGAERIDVHGQ